MSRCGFEILGEGLKRSSLKCLHGTRPSAQDRADGLDREVRDDPQEHHVALVGREAFQRRQELAGADPGSRCDFDVVCGGAKRKVFWSLEDLCGATVALAGLVDQQASGNGEQPRAELDLVAVEGVQVGEGSEKDVVHVTLWIRGMPGPTEAVETLVERAVEPIEAVRFPPFRRSKGGREAEFCAWSAPCAIPLFRRHV